ncbi:MAG: hypothetical protein KAG53_08935, partial [Endozoicomonadaceae bacterium]|nr:hypothetical protein [Endozoicomonadaceae bacterium]
PASDLVSVIQVGIAFYALANIPCCEAGAIENVIEIDDFDMFQKIGRDKDYPSDGHYILTKDLVGNNNIHPVIEDFSGSLDGQGYSILQHSGCLIRNFKGYGIIGNIIFKYSNGIDASCSPLVAMFARDHSLLKNVRVENYKLCSKQDHIHVAIMIGNLINWARIEHCSVVDASVVFQGEGANFAFFVLSMHDDSSVYNSAIINSSVNLDTKTLSFCGSIVHMFERSRCSNITMINCTMTLSADKFAYGTFGGVWLYNNAQVNNVLAIRCNIEITGTGLTKAGIGAASLWGADTLSNFNMAIDSNLKIDGDGGSTGIGAAESVGAQSHNNVAIGCHIEVEGVKSSAAVGIGYEHKKDTKSHNNIAIKTRIEAFNRDSTVAISVGNSFECSNLYNTIIDSTLATLERVSTMVFSGSYNRAIICRDLLYYRIGLLNKNCTLNQQGFDAYVNRIANWNTTVLNTGRVVRLPEPVNVTMIKEDVTSIENTVIPDRAVSPNMEIEQKNSGVIAVALASGLMVSFFMVSYYRGYKKGSRGRALLMYPLTMCKNCIKGTTRPERAVNMDVFYSEVSSTHNSDNALDPSLDGRGSDSPPAYSDLEIMHSASASASANLPSYSEVMQNSVE